MNINYSPFSEDTTVDFNDGEIEHGSMAAEFIMRAAQAVKEDLGEGKQQVKFSLSDPAEDVTSQYNIRVNGNVYSFRVQKWDGVFKRMDHNLENTSVLVEQGDVQIIEQDFTIKIEDYLTDEGFDVEVNEEEIEGPDAEEAKEFLDEKFNM